MKLRPNINIDRFFGTEEIDFQYKKPRTDFYTIPQMLPYNAFDYKQKLFLNENSVAFLIELSPIGGISEAEISSISNLFSKLEEGTVVQILQYASPNINYMLGSWVKERLGKKPILEALAKERMDFLKNSNIKPLFDSKPFVTRDIRLFLSVSSLISSSKDYSEIAIKLNRVKSYFESQIKSINSSYKVMEAEDLIDLASEILSIGLKPISFNYNRINPIAREISRPDQSIEVMDDHLLLNEKFCAKTMTVKTYPHHWSQNMNNNLIGDFFNANKQINCPFISSFSFRIASQENAKNKATYRMSRAIKLAKSPIAELIPSAKKRAIDARFLVDKLDEGNKLIDSIHHITFFSTKEELHRNQQSIENIYVENRFELVAEEGAGQLINFQAVLPMVPGNLLIDDFILLQKTNRPLSWTASNQIPLIGEYKGNTVGKGLLLVGRRGQLFNWTPFNSAGNFNVCIAGRPGAGKSFLMQELISGFVASNARVVIIDDGYSFENTVKLLGGKFIEFSNRSSIGINPFSTIDQNKFESDSDYRSSIISFLVSLLSQMARNDTLCSEEEKKDLEKACMNAWQIKGNDTEIADVIQSLKVIGNERAENLAHLLHSFSREGVYGSYFIGKSAVDTNELFIGFELSVIKSQKHLQRVVMLTIMFLISEVIYRGDRKINTAIFIDEAWDLISGGEIGNSIAGLVRRIRKYGGSVIFGTQGIEDFYQNKAAQACFENSDWRILMSQKPESIALLKKAEKLSINDEQERILQSISKSDNFSELAICGSDTFAIGRLIVDPFTIMLYSSKAEHFRRKKELIDSGLSVVDAINQAKEEFFGHGK